MAKIETFFFKFCLPMNEKGRKLFVLLNFNTGNMGQNIIRPFIFETEKSVPYRGIFVRRALPDIGSMLSDNFRCPMRSFG